MEKIKPITSISNIFMFKDSPRKEDFEMQKKQVKYEGKSFAELLEEIQKKDENKTDIKIFDYDIKK